MIGPDDLVARLRRLDALARGLARELALWQDAGSPLLYPEPGPVASMPYLLRWLGAEQP